jgi:hypothetical protein
MQHSDIGELIDADQLRPMVAEVLSQGDQAYEHKLGEPDPRKDRVAGSGRAVVETTKKDI